MYVPGNILTRERNEIVMIELQRLSPRNNYYVRFANTALLDGSPDGNIGGNDGSGESKSFVTKAFPHLIVILIAIIFIKNH